MVVLIGLPTAQAQISDLDERDQEEALAIGMPPGATVADPGRAAFGRTYGQWASEWWKWALQFPASGNPLLDETGELCGLGDQGPVWFLAGNFGGTTVRECTAPAGKAFFFPLFNVISFAPEYGVTVEQVRADANGDIEQDPDPFIACTVDGIPVDDPFAYRAQSPPGGFLLDDITLLADFGFDPGPRFPSIADGYWIMLNNLGPGEHEIRIQSAVPDAGFDLDVTYFLTLGQ